MYQGENGVFFAHFHNPELMAIMELENSLRRVKEEPIENIADFQTLLQVSRLPKPIRRFAWWYITHRAATGRPRGWGHSALAFIPPWVRNRSIP